MATTELYPKRQRIRKEQENDRKALGLMPEISGSWFIQPRGALFLSLIVTNCSGAVVCLRGGERGTCLGPPSSGPLEVFRA